MRVAYNQAPDAVYWWLDGYFDFNEAQSLRVREDLNALQRWHRSAELPAYAEILQKLQRAAPADTTPGQVCEVFAAARERALALSQVLEPTIIAVAPMLGKEQIAHLERALAKRNQKWRKDWADGSPKERAARRTKQVVERAERFYGPLDEKQLAAARASVEASSFDAQLTLRETLRRQQDALQTLRHLQSGQSLQLDPGAANAVNAAMRALFERSIHSPDAAYRGYIEDLMRSGCQGFALLHNSTTAAQRTRAVETLKGYEADLRALALQK